MSLIDINDATHRFAYWKAVSDYVKRRLHAKTLIRDGEKFSRLKDLYEKFSTENAGKQWGRQTTPPIEVIEFLWRLYPAEELDSIARENDAPEMQVILLRRRLEQCSREVAAKLIEKTEEFERRMAEARERIEKLEERNKELVDKLLEK